MSVVFLATDIVDVGRHRLTADISQKYGMACWPSVPAPLTRGPAKTRQILTDDVGRCGSCFAPAPHCLSFDGPIYDRPCETALTAVACNFVLSFTAVSTCMCFHNDSSDVCDMTFTCVEG